MESKLVPMAIGLQGTVQVKNINMDLVLDGKSHDILVRHVSAAHVTQLEIVG